MNGGVSRVAPYLIVTPWQAGTERPQHKPPRSRCILCPTPGYSTKDFRARIYAKPDGENQRSRSTSSNLSAVLTRLVNKYCGTSPPSPSPSPSSLPLPLTVEDAPVKDTPKLAAPDSRFPYSRHGYY
ncbi:hypothetical protein E2C01_017235 [Portunus trituberculatus]|uniref:Uncharacterized protein n=1 Tax=Portunus trituberculatus TaxID=210409 RepID=A0A5B7DSW6_PORTR|nr:hypothetical protein [Portunus trituberculatus]